MDGLKIEPTTGVKLKFGATVTQKHRIRLIRGNKIHAHGLTTN